MLNRIRKMLKQQEGFTLVELMIVVVILGIISGIGIQQYGNVQKRARDTAHVANHRIISSATQMYLLMNPPANDETLEDIKITHVIDAGFLEGIPTNPNTNAQDYEIAIMKSSTSEQYVITITPALPESKES